MPLLDHFRPQGHPVHRWDSFHSNWATRIADSLNERLPPEFLAEEHVHAGPHLEIDVATTEGAPSREPSANGHAAPSWEPAASVCTIPATFPDDFEVRVFANSGGRTLVAVVELISPGNKDRAAERRAFAGKCASYLHEGVSVVVIDIVTERRGNLHNETMDLLDAPAAARFGPEVRLYAVAYRPVLRQEREEIDCWPVELRLGEPLPTMPLRLTGDRFVPVDFEATYTEACRRRRII
jgi:hypothetical protein